MQLREIQSSNQIDYMVVVYVIYYIHSTETLDDYSICIHQIKMGLDST